jgi:hypothetical protein
MNADEADVDRPDAPLLPECEFADDIPRDAQGCLPVGAMVAAHGCRISHAECFTLINPEDAFGTKKKEKTRMAKTPSAPPSTPAAPAPAVLVEEETLETEASPEGEAEEKAAPLAGPPRAPAALQAHTEVPASQTAVGELSAFLPKDAGGATSVLLALLAVAGGGAGWKFYQSFAKQKHEQRMKELEIEATRVEKVEAVQAERADDRDDHKACEAARATDRAAFEEKLAALEARLVEAEKPKADDIDLPFDPAELNDRIEQIEKALKKAPSPPRTAPVARDVKKKASKS